MDKEQASKVLVDLLQKVLTKRLRLGHSKLNEHIHNGRKLEAFMNNYLARIQILDKRQFFSNWKNFRERMKTVDFNEFEDGPRNLECWSLRVECNAFADMMHKDGASD